jgi:hypothetical protein
MSPGDFASKVFRSQNGIEARVQYGNKAFNKTLDLEYSNITDALAASIHDHYLACNGTLYWFFLLDKPKSGAPGFHSSSGKFVYGQAYTDVKGFIGTTFYFGLDSNKSPTAWFTTAPPVNGAVTHPSQGLPGFYVDAASLTGYYPDPNPNAFASARYSATPFGLKYRYAEPPQFNSVKPGRMSVTVKLVGVLDS